MELTKLTPAVMLKMLRKPFSLLPISALGDGGSARHPIFLGVDMAIVIAIEPFEGVVPYLQTYYNFHPLDFQAPLIQARKYFPPVDTYDYPTLVDVMETFFTRDALFYAPLTEAVNAVPDAGNILLYNFIDFDAVTWAKYFFHATVLQITPAADVAAHDFVDHVVYGGAEFPEQQLVLLADTLWR